MYKDMGSACFTVYEYQTNHYEYQTGRVAAFYAKGFGGYGGTL